jgi:hypothetical protein
VTLADTRCAAPTGHSSLYLALELDSPSLPTPRPFCHPLSLLPRPTPADSLAPSRNSVPVGTEVTARSAEAITNANALCRTWNPVQRVVVFEQHALSPFSEEKKKKETHKKKPFPHSLIPSLLRGLQAVRSQQL